MQAQKDHKQLERGFCTGTGAAGTNLFALCGLFHRSIQRKNFYKHVLLLALILPLKGFLWLSSLVGH